MDQIGVPAVFMRGGTSKGLFFKRGDLPDDVGERDRFFLGALGSPDPYGRQLDGMGGGLSSLSKVMIVARSERQGIDVDYTFGQVAVGAPYVDYKANCGNLSSAVGAFAVDEGLVPPAPGAEEIVVRMFNTNTRKLVNCHVPTVGNKARVGGDFRIDGVSGSAARIRLDFVDPGGSACRSLLPTGRPTDVLDAGSGPPITVSIVDATNPVTFVRAADVGLTATELAADLRAREGALARLEAIRRAAAVAAGLASDVRDAERNWNSSPKIAVVGPPRDARLPTGELLAASEVDVSIRMISMGAPHGAIPLTGAMCVAAAAGIHGTVVHEATRSRADDGILRVGHASGALPVTARVRREGGTWSADTATVYRTARRLMCGIVYAPSRPDVA